jgi:hypothetical protein
MIDIVLLPTSLSENYLDLKSAQTHTILCYYLILIKKENENNKIQTRDHSVIHALILY